MLKCKPESLLIWAIVLLSACVMTPPPVPIEDLVAMRREAAFYYQKGQFSQAAQRYQELATKVPMESELWFLLGNSHARIGNTDQAVKAYREAVIRDPTYAKAWYNMGVLRLMEGTRILLDAEQHLVGNEDLKTAVQQLGEGVLKLIEQENARLESAANVGEVNVDADEVEIIVFDAEPESPAQAEDSGDEE